MRLIETRTLDLCEFTGDKIPEEYAILSHRWEDEEVTFQDWQDLSVAKSKKGFAKIDMACNLAQRHGLDYLWVDTNCIDKTSSAELSEAVNSMFSWYQRSTVCYAYLSDVELSSGGFDRMNQEHVEQFCGSKWFARGWTLQELLAPVALTFYSQDWSEIAPRSVIADLICETTKIDAVYLQGDGTFKDATIAQKMSWVSRRRTERPEDIAYCMLGIFDVNMPLLYGEGSKSFIRLQEEIIRTSNDQTIFCWTWTDSVPPGWVSLLAPCPQAFQHSEGFVSANSNLFSRPTFKVTNAGLSITLPVIKAWSYDMGILNASIINSSADEQSDRLLCVPIHGHLDTRQNRRRVAMRRLPFPPGPLPIPPSWVTCQLHMYILSTPDPTSDRLLLASDTMPSEQQRYSFLLVFDHPEKPPESSSQLLGPMGLNRSNDTRRMDRMSPFTGIGVFPPGAFDCDKSLITIHRTSTSSGVLIRLDLDGKSRILFLGLSFRSHRPYRYCGVVPKHIAKATLNERGLLKALLHNATELKEEFNVSWRHGIGITVGEEAVTTAGSIYLAYITCEHGRTNASSGRL